jgi:hypothetical protein
VAFLDLSTCRQLGMEVGPIPWTAIHDYADRKYLSSDEREELEYVIRYVDTVYLMSDEDLAKRADRLKQRDEEEADG